MFVLNKPTKNCNIYFFPLLELNLPIVNKKTKYIEKMFHMNT